MCDFGGQVGEQHQQSPTPALLEACDPVVSESGGSGKPQVQGNQFHFHSERGWREKLGKAEKEKSRPIRACKGSALKHGIASMKAEFYSAQRLDWRGLRTACITETLSSGDRV